MDDSAWSIPEQIQYTCPKLQNQDEINNLLQNLKKSGLNEVEFQIQFKAERNLQKFLEIYHQQMTEQQYNYINDEEEKRQKDKFRRWKDFNSSDYDVRQLSFPNFRFLNIFMKIYESKLKQLEIEYHYKFQKKSNIFRVYFPKNQKISSFFKNQIFEMKTKLYLYYCNNPVVIQKIKYSEFFNKLVESKKIAAEYHKRLNQIEVAIFYSNEHSRKEIIEIVNKNLLEHMTIMSLFDNKIAKPINQVIFKLMVSLIHETIKKAETENEIKIQLNFDKSCILINDRHECFIDAKQQIELEINKLIIFRLQGRLEGDNMRTIYNKIIRNHKLYPYMRVKYSKRALFCVINCEELMSSQKYITSFIELFQQYFQNLKGENKVTFFTKFSHNSRQFLRKVLELVEKSSVMLENADYSMIADYLSERDQPIPLYQIFSVDGAYNKYLSKVVLGIKQIGEVNEAKVRNDFFEIFIKLVCKTNSIQKLTEKMKLKSHIREGLMRFDNSSFVISSVQHQSVADSTQEHLNKFIDPKQSQSGASFSESQKTEIKSKSKYPENESREEQAQIAQFRRQTSPYRNKQKRFKHIQINFVFTSPSIDSELDKFWDYLVRQRKLQKAFKIKYPQSIAKRNMKIFTLTLKKPLDAPQEGQLQMDKLYISTTIQKNNMPYYHLIDENQLIRLTGEVKQKILFVLFKYQDREMYIPSYALMFF